LVCDKEGHQRSYEVLLIGTEVAGDWLKRVPC
jgi:hypothetical protein